MERKGKDAVKYETMDKIRESFFFFFSYLIKSKLNLLFIIHVACQLGNGFDSRLESMHPAPPEEIDQQKRNTALPMRYNIKRIFSFFRKLSKLTFQLSKAITLDTYVLPL